MCEKPCFPLKADTYVSACAQRAATLNARTVPAAPWHGVLIAPGSCRLSNRQVRSCTFRTYYACLVQGHPKLQSTFARISGYVEQTDIHSPQVPRWPLLVTDTG